MPRYVRMDGANLCGPGLYIATLNNIDGLPINRGRHDDPHVNQNNFHIGQAKRLTNRYGQFVDTFGTENVNFFPLFRVAGNDLDQAERHVLDALDAAGNYRIGPRIDWFQDIEALVAVGLALRALQEHMPDRFEVFKTF